MMNSHVAVERGAARAAGRANPPITRCILAMWHRYTKGGVASLLALLASAGSAAGQIGGAAPQPQLAHVDAFAHVRALIEKLITEEGIPSVAVAVAKNGEILWQEGFGWADRERRIAATAHTPYATASILKPISATAMMVLHQRGKIDLDAPIENYLGGARFTGHAGDTREVTARRIMAHSAGLPTHWYFHPDTNQLNTLETIRRYGIVVFPPGTRFEYSNRGYRSLDLALANASGERYSEFVRREVFLPLGMTRSGLGAEPAWESDIAQRYDGKQNPIPYFMGDIPWMGHIWSSAHDLLRFGMFHIGTPLPDQRPVLSAGTLAAMQRVSSAPGSEWGLGWSLGTDRGYRVVRHGGQQPGADNQLVLYPDEKVVIVMLSNQNNWKVRQVVDEIAAVVLPQYAERKSAAAAPAPRADSAARPVGKWVGTVTTYEGEEPFTLTFQADGDVVAKIGERMTTYVNHFRAEGGAFGGWFYGVMNTSDALPYRHNLNFTLVPQGREMVGQLFAYTAFDPGIFGLPAFIRIRPEAAPAKP
ncbi:MAG: beta-lactamase family protein [Gemmatimonadetes bacterium]|nr:beta-lactamase family protein [Gemmatimonadota bacterium]